MKIYQDYFDNTDVGKGISNFDYTTEKPENLLNQHGIFRWLHDANEAISTTPNSLEEFYFQARLTVSPS